MEMGFGTRTKLVLKKMERNDNKMNELLESINMHKINLVLFRLGIIVSSIVLFASLALSQQCQAITKKGCQCKRKAVAGSQYCWQHKSQSDNAVNSNTSTNGSVKNGQKIKHQKKANEYMQCQAKTKKGKQCSRKAQLGSKYCWQHGG